MVFERTMVLPDGEGGMEVLSGERSFIARVRRASQCKDFHPLLRGVYLEARGYTPK